MTDHTLADLGWSDFFQSQGVDDTEHPMRVSAVQRDRLTALGSTGERAVAPAPGLSTGEIAVGDWIVVDAAGRAVRVLDRQTALSRRAAGSDARSQLIAANATTLAIVTSCNADFNAARLERYLVLATGAGCLPLIVLTKADQAEDPASFCRQAEALSPLVTAIAINARSEEDLDRLSPWCRPGETLALVGSSGVGKTTILNGLTGGSALTQDIRADDAKGRHTTTARELVRARSGGWIIDTPGMRALRIADAQDGIGAVFADLEDLAAACRFSDCAHDGEPGCAVGAAIEAGDLDPARLTRWRKLVREDERHTQTLADARARDRELGKVYRNAKAARRFRRDD